ncbi:hypothetical protein [Streptomyces sp. NPDC047197]
MTAVAIEITPRPTEPEEPTSLVVVEDLEDLTAGATSGCNDDNPYR